LKYFSIPKVIVEVEVTKNSFPTLLTSDAVLVETADIVCVNALTIFKTEVAAEVARSFLLISLLKVAVLVDIAFILLCNSFPTIEVAVLVTARALWYELTRDTVEVEVLVTERLLVKALIVDIMAVAVDVASADLPTLLTAFAVPVDSADTIFPNLYARVMVAVLVSVTEIAKLCAAELVITGVAVEVTDIPVEEAACRLKLPAVTVFNIPSYKCK
jgi:hypothetical protein